MDKKEHPLAQVCGSHITCEQIDHDLWFPIWQSRLSGVFDFPSQIEPLDHFFHTFWRIHSTIFVVNSDLIDLGSYELCLACSCINLLVGKTLSFFSLCHVILPFCLPPITCAFIVSFSINFYIQIMFERLLCHGVHVCV